MSVKIENILSDKTLAAIPANVRTAVTRDIETYIESVESENTKRFDSMIESMATEFEATAKKTMVESVGKAASDNANVALMKALKDIAAIVENAGVPTTEKTKELMKQFQKANSDLKAAYRVQQEYQNKINDNNKMLLVAAKTKGCSPQIIDAANEYFRTKDYREVDDRAINDFIEGKINDSGLRSDYSSEFNNMDVDFNGETVDNVSLDKIEQMLDSLPARHESIEGSAPKKNLRSGIKQKRVSGPDTDLNALNEAASMSGDSVVDADVAQALKNIERLGGLFNYRMK